MGTTLNRKTYAKLIDENIAEIEKHMPDSLERRHTIDVLKWSINALYDTPPQKDRSVEFAEWILKNEYKGMRASNGEFMWYKSTKDLGITTYDLYTIFLIETNQ